MEGCLLSIDRFAKNLAHLCIITDTDDDFDYDAIFLKMVTYQPILKRVPLPYWKRPLVDDGIGYTWQQVIKMECHWYFDSDFFLIWDSDMMFYRDIDVPTYYFHEGKPMMFYREWSPAIASVRWKPTVDVFFPHTSYDTMPLHFFVLRRDTLQNFAGFIKEKTGLSIADAFLTAGETTTWSEFMLYYNFVLDRERDNYSVRQLDSSMWSRRPFLQFPSRKKPTDQLIWDREARYVLKGGYTLGDFDYRVVFNRLSYPRYVCKDWDEVRGLLGKNHAEWPDYELVRFVVARDSPHALSFSDQELDELYFRAKNQEIIETNGFFLVRNRWAVNRMIGPVLLTD